MRRVHSISRIAACAAVAGMFGWTSPSSAYRMIQVPNWGRYLSSTPVTCDNTGGFAHWYTTSIPWRVTSSDSGRIAAVQAALNAWTAVPGASHVLSYAGTIGVDPFLLYAGDGINQIYWGGDPGGWCTGSCLAITALEIQNDQTIVESDILFNNAHPWSTSGGTYDIQTVATHELGHSLGIHHTEVTSTPRPTMYAGYFGTDGRSLENDDVQALQCSEDWYVSPAYEGLHETTTCREVKGWARNAKRSNGYARVKVWNNNVSWREVLANEYRPDVGYHGWTTTPPGHYRTGQYRKITAYFPDGRTLTGSPQYLICQVPIFTYQTPEEFIDTLGKSWSVGNDFSSSIPGYVTALRYYRAAEETGIHTLKLWTLGGAPLGSVDVNFGSDLTAGWEVGWLPGNGILIQAGVGYTVTVTTTGPKMSKTACGFGSGPITNGPLTATGGRWVEGTGIFPTNGSCSNFWTDVYFDQ